jgi:pantothenate kinase
MELRNYLKRNDRKAFAHKCDTTVNYLNNLCQHPEQAGKKMIRKIISASGGAVTFDDMSAGKSA